jgi:hypothetical protein
MAERMGARLRAMSRGELAVVGGSTALLAAMLLLPWITTGCSVSGCGALDAGSLDGLHGWGWLAFLALAAVATLRFLRTSPGGLRLPPLPLGDPEIYLAAGIVETVAVLLYWIEYRDSVDSFLVVTAGVGPGWVLALAGGVATAVGGRLLRVGAPARRRR